MDFVPLSPEQKRHFDEEGYLIVRGALPPPQIERLIAAGDRLMASDQTGSRQTNSATYDSFRNCVALDEAFLEMLAHPATVPLVVQLFGPNLHLCTSHLIYKAANPPETPRTFRQPGWHRDVANSPYDLGHAHLPRMEMKIAYYLTDAAEPCSGVTLFAPGSNHWREALRLPEGRWDPEGAVEPSLRAGDAAFFENRTYHAGAVNLTGRTTKALMMGYSYNWMRPMDYLVQPDELLEKVDDLGKQLLGGLKGPEGRFVPGGVTKPLHDWCREHGFAYRAPA